jgi:D-arginine dehydrogenase
MSNKQVIIIGAGIAGAATAYFLTRKGFGDILILEKEKIAGAQSTGRNAAILRTMIPDPFLSKLACESAEFFHHPPPGFSTEPLVDMVGVWLAAGGEQIKTLKGWCDDNPETGLDQMDASIMYQRVPILAKGLERIACKQSDGVLDVHSILQGYLRGACSAGAHVRFGCEFKNLRIRDGRIWGVETSEGFMEASKVVVSNGAWASVSSTFGGYSLPFTPYRRHLLVTEPNSRINPRWPVIWIVGEDFYFRPESGGLLMSGCDTVEVTPERGEITDPSELERIAGKASRWLPSFADIGVARAWSGMRTFAPDDLFVIGSDPRLQGLYWVAGMGGHGVTCSPVIGSIAADWIADGKSGHPAASLLAPDRLCK